MLGFLNNLSTNQALQKVLEGKLQPKEIKYTMNAKAINNLIPAKPKEGNHTHTHHHHHHEQQNNKESTIIDH